MSRLAAKPRATIADLLALPEDRRVELVNGEIVEKAAPTFEHSSAQTGLAAELGGSFGRGGSGVGGWWIATEVDTAYEEHQLYRHDLAGWRRERVPVKPQGRPIKARPDWVCEILSPSNWRQDTVTKFQVLYRHGVPHYWIMDVQHQELTVYRWYKDGYVVACKAVPGEKAALEPFDAIEIEVSRLFGLD